MATTNVQRTQVIETITTKSLSNNAELEKKLGKSLGSPINGKEVGDEFQITLTGNLEIREFNGVRGAYLTSKEGYSVKANASFNKDIHKEGAIMDCVCREVPFDGDNGEVRKVKFTAFKG